MKQNGVNHRQNGTYHEKHPLVHSDYPKTGSKEISQEMERCFSRLILVQQQGIQCKLRQMSIALHTMEKELTQFLTSGES